MHKRDLILFCRTRMFNLVSIAGHMACGLCGLMPPAGVVARTSLNYRAGATHRFSQLLQAFLVALICTPGRHRSPALCFFLHMWLNSWSQGGRTATGVSP